MSTAHLDPWRSLSRSTRFQIGFYLAAALVGGLLVMAQDSFESQAWRSTSNGLGIALVAASILGFAQRLFFFDDFRLELAASLEASLRDFLGNVLPFLNEGFEQVFTDREAAMRSFSRHIELENERIIVIGSSLSGLLDPSEGDRSKARVASLLRRKIANGVAVQFLLTHPAVAFLREDAEGRRPGDIRDEIIETLKYLVGGDHVTEGAPSIGVPMESIRLYHGTPTIFSVILSDTMLINPYSYQATAFDNFCIQITKQREQGLFSKILRAHYRKPWRNEITSTALTDRVLCDIRSTTMETLFPARRGELVSDSAPREPAFAERPDEHGNHVGAMKSRRIAE